MGKTVVILSETFGNGDEELGRILMKNFLYSLARAQTPPSRVMFANTGVRLVCEGSESLEDLELLVELGIPVGACGTCLEHLGLADSQVIGGVGAMPQSVDLFMSDEPVITIA